MKALKLVLIVFVLVWAETGASSENAGKNDGRFWVILETENKTAPGGVVCAGARGHLQIANGIITGTLISDLFMDFEVSGSIDDKGYVTGGMAVTPSSSESAWFGDDKMGLGTWSYLGCHGTQKTWKVPDVQDPNSDLFIKLDLRNSLCTNPVLLNCLAVDKDRCEYVFDEVSESCRTLNSMIDISATAKLLTGCIVTRQIQALSIDPEEINACFARASLKRE